MCSLILQVSAIVFLQKWIPVDEERNMPGMLKPQSTSYLKVGNVRYCSYGDLATLHMFPFFSRDSQIYHKNFVLCGIFLWFCSH